MLSRAVEKAIQDGYRNFISGMALGVDIWAAEMVIQLKKQHPYINLEAAIPCANQDLRWRQNDKDRYQGLLKKCDLQTVLQTAYTADCMIIRNKYMVDKSACPE